MVRDRTDNVADVCPVLMDVSDDHCPALVIGAVHIDLVKRFAGVELRLHACAKGAIGRLLHIDRFVFDLVGIGQGVFVHGMDKGHGKAVSLAHFVPGVDLAGVAVAQGQIVAGARKKHGGRCNNRYYCSGRNYVFPQMRIHVNTR